MKFLQLLLFLAPLSVHAQALDDRKACWLLADHLRSSVQRNAGQADVQLITAALPQKQPVLLLGENHNNDGMIGYYPVFIPKLIAANPSMNCVWMERAHKFQPSVDSFMEGKIGSHEFFTESCEKCGPSLETSPDSRFHHDVLLMDALRPLGTKVLFVDEDIVADDAYVDWYEKKLMDWVMDPYPEFSQDEITFVALRNRTMSLGIAESLGSGKCTGGALIVGIDHVKKTSAPERIISISDRLSKLGIPNLSVYGASQSRVNVRDCVYQDTIGLNRDTGTAIRNSADPGIAPLLEKFPELKEPLSDFDFLLYPPNK